ncbi:diaminopimelate epimerase [bacterium]|nr:diaminopimelate epimerase [bacterium]
MLIQPRKLVLEFTKMSGTGNDFIVIDNRFYHFSAEELSQMALNLCKRRLGVGADGLLALGNPVTAGAAYRMSYYNADGSLGTMCGNGARCLARYARDAGIETDPLIFDSDAGLYTARIGENRSVVRLYVPQPERFKPGLLLDCAEELEATGTDFIWTGTEHLVVPVLNALAVDVPLLGKKIRFDSALQPTGANVNFVQRNDDDSLTVRTFEKGVEEETLACGTGSIASAIISNRLGRIKSNPTCIHMPGGDLYVGWEGAADDPVNLYLEGEVTVVFRATTEI